jgi:disulfide bond formation protein DsbB
MHPILYLVEQRKGWAILSTSFFLLFLTALFFQHYMNLAPCVMCIEERILILSLAVFSLIPMINPKLMSLRVIGYLGLILIAYAGYDLAAEHVLLQKGEGGLMATCSIYPRVPSWLPLHEWLPSLFMPTGNCGEISWTFMNTTMVEWIKYIFTFYIALPIIMVWARITFP